MANLPKSFIERSHKDCLSEVMGKYHSKHYTSVKTHSSAKVLRKAQALQPSTKKITKSVNKFMHDLDEGLFAGTNHKASDQYHKLHDKHKPDDDDSGDGGAVAKGPQYQYTLARSFTK